MNVGPRKSIIGEEIRVGLQIVQEILFEARGQTHSNK